MASADISRLTMPRNPVSSATTAGDSGFGLPPVWICIPDLGSDRLPAEAAIDLAADPPAPEPVLAETTAAPPEEARSRYTPPLPKMPISDVLARAQRRFSPSTVLSVMTLVGVLFVMLLFRGDGEMIETPPSNTVVRKKSLNVSKPEHKKKKFRTNLQEPAKTEVVQSESEDVSPWPRNESISPETTNDSEAAAVSRAPVYEARRPAAPFAGPPAEFEGTITKPEFGGSHERY